LRIESFAVIEDAEGQRIRPPGKFEAGSECMAVPDNVRQALLGDPKQPKGTLAWNRWRYFVVIEINLQTILRRHLSAKAPHRLDQPQMFQLGRVQFMG